ncbi:DNA polymerase Y family protein [Guyparkeria hydrothermalis]|uniref:Y-family DNA polymerase n=1 Tax=Guyparkeria hydrothermalis TaxID=923 RepID=UPI002022564B|nr:DNA polymerase Y family protein [Guyparkeria hydrothermalis]MCL7743946.1 DNA polymerase Y family protein [Guyparkeria hydrothermalis]
MAIEPTIPRSSRGTAFWLALRFPEAWFESRCPEEDRRNRPPAVQLLDQAGRSRVVAVNRPAADMGIEAGQSLAVARSRHRAAAPADAPPLRCLETDDETVSNWLAQWGEWAGTYTSRVTCPSGGSMPGLLLELGGSAALFGGLEALIRTVMHSLAAHQLTVRAAGAPHPRVAWALAVVADGGRPWLCDRRDQLAAISRLPLAALDWPGDWIERFEELGLMRLGDVRRLPRDGLGMRTAPALLEDLDRLFAERDWPLSDLEAPVRYAREVTLWDPASQIDRLLLLARAPLVGLAEFLRRRRLAVASFRVLLGHETGAATDLTLATAEPGRDESLWLEQLRLQLESVGGMPPVTRLRVEADRFVTPSAGQGSLFADDGERDRDERALWHRLRARLGEAAVGRLQRVPGLVPPLCSRSRPVEAAALREVPALSAAASFRPLWWLEGPRRLDAPLRRRAEIERVETAWWSAAEEAADYCAGELAGGRAVCLRRDRQTTFWELIGFDG